MHYSYTRSWQINVMLQANKCVMSWKSFLHYWPFGWGFHQGLVDLSHKRQVIQILFSIYFKRLLKKAQLPVIWDALIALHGHFDAIELAHKFKAKHLTLAYLQLPLTVLHSILAPMWPCWSLFGTSIHGFRTPSKIDGDFDWYHRVS